MRGAYEPNQNRPRTADEISACLAAERRPTVRRNMRSFTVYIRSGLAQLRNLRLPPVMSSEPMDICRPRALETLVIWQRIQSCIPTSERTTAWRISLPDRSVDSNGARTTSPTIASATPRLRARWTSVPVPSSPTRACRGRRTPPASRPPSRPCRPLYPSS